MLLLPCLAAKSASLPLLQMTSQRCVPRHAPDPQDTPSLDPCYGLMNQRTVRRAGLGPGATPWLFW